MRQIRPDHLLALPLLVLVITWLLQLSFTGLNTPMLLLSSGFLMLALFLAFIVVPVVNPFVGRGCFLPWLMLLMALWMVFSPCFSAAPYRSWLYAWLWLALPVVFFISLQTQKTCADTLRILLPVAGSLLALISIYQFHFMIEVYSYRAPGTLLDPNSYAGLLNLLLLPLVGWLMQQKQSESLLLVKLKWFAVVLMVGGICSTGSRAGIIIMFMGIVFLSLTAWRRGGRALVGLMVVGICLLWIVESMLVTDGALIERLQSASLHDPSVSARFLIWDSAWQLIQDAPWWGVGLGTFALLYPKTRSVLEVETVGGYVHSDPLQLLLEGGWPLLLLVSVIVVYAAIYLFKLFRAKGEINLQLVAFGFAILLAAAHACVNFNFYNVSILSVIALYLSILYLHFYGENLVPVHHPVVKVTVNMVVSLLLVSSTSLLLMDYRAGELQKPLMTKGLQATFTTSQCEQAALFSFFRPSMPGLAMVEGVCALKKNNCEAVNDAISFFDRAIDASPMQAELYAFVAQLELMTGQCVAGAAADARVRLLQALDQNPGSLPVRFLLYKVDMQNGHVADAEAWITGGLNYGMDFNMHNKFVEMMKKLHINTVK